MPKVKLTDRGIKKLIAKNGKQTDYFDKDLKNFAIRVSPSGHMSFCVFYRIGRRPRRHTLGSYPTLGLSEARDEAQKALYRVTVKGEDPARQKATDRDAMTFTELAKEFLEKHSKAGLDTGKPKKKSWREDERIINRHLIPAFGDARANDVTRPMVREMLEEIAETAPTMANRVLALVSKIFNWATQRDLLEVNRCAHLEAPGGREKQRDRVLSDDEIRIVWAAFEKESFRTAGMLKLRLLTAQRGGEVATMRWMDLDFDSAVWGIPGEFTKNTSMHRVPLSPEAIRILDGLKAAAETDAKKHSREVSPWVFPGRRAGVSQTELQKTIQRVRANTIPEGAGPDAGVSFRGHDLRRTAASKMTEMGIPRLIVKKILNHADNEITAIYDRFAYDKEKREALTLWAKRLTIITSGLREVAKA